MDVSRLNRPEFLLISLFMGFSSSIIQVLLIREIITLCRGNELIIGMIYFSWFLGIYIGAQYKGSEDTRGLEKRVFFSLFALPALAGISIYSSRFFQIIFPRVQGTFYTLSFEIIISVIFTMPVGFFVGFFFPSLVSLISGELKDRSGGIIFYFESLGAFAGGLLFSFILVDKINPFGIIFMFLMLAVIIIFFQRNRKFIILIIIPLIFIIYSNKIEYNLFRYLWNKTHIGELVQYERSKYQLIEAESYSNTISIYGDGMLMYTLPDRYESRGIFHLIQSLKQDHRKILLLGSPGSLLYNLSNTDIDLLYYFEIDPAVWKIIYPYIRSYYKYPGNSKVTVYNQDIRNFFRTNTIQFDMIIILPSHPENIMLNRLYTQEFYSLCREHLDERGIFITCLHGFSNYMSGDLRNYIGSIYSAFLKEFPYYVNTSGETIYLIGGKSKGILPENVDQLVTGYVKSWQYANRDLLENEIKENFSPDELRTFFEKTQLEYFEEIIGPLIHRSEPNRDLKPGAYWKNIVFTAFKEGSVLYGLIQGFVFIPAVIFIISLAALFSLWRRYGSSPLKTGFLMYLNGFISISTMIILILIYQNAHGIIYHRVSLITALFMFGLSLGGYIFNRKRFGLPYIYIAMAVPLLLMLIFAVDFTILYWALILIFSFICGGIFPTLFKLSVADYYASASVLDSMDHFGSIAGSLLTVAFLLPAVGIQGIIIINILLLISAGMIAFVMHKINSG